MVIEDDVFRIEPGSVAEFSMSKQELEQLLDSLPPEEDMVLFKMDSQGKVSVFSKTHD